jgi:hypothetical protein
MTIPVVRSSPVLAVLVAGVSAMAPAQVAPLPPVRAVAFPPAASVLIGVSSYGDRAGYTDASGSQWTESLGNGPVFTGRLQSPLGRRFGLHVGGAFTYRSHREDKDGSPQFTSNDHVVSLRFDGGLLFRFKPAAPIYFGGAVTYYHHGLSPVVVASSGATSELGWGLGLGADFGRRPGSNIFGRVEFWSYWVRPKADSLIGAYTLRSSARDGALSVGITYLLNFHAPRPR